MSDTPKDGDFSAYIDDLMKGKKVAVPQQAPVPQVPKGPQEQPVPPQPVPVPRAPEPAPTPVPEPAPAPIPQPAPVPPSAPAPQAPGRTSVADEFAQGPASTAPSSAGRPAGRVRVGHKSLTHRLGLLMIGVGFMGFVCAGALLEEPIAMILASMGLAVFGMMLAAMGDDSKVEPHHFDSGDP